jgi:hypothetical protein
MADDEKTFVLTLPDANGDRREVTISAAQLLDAGAFRAFAYYCDEETLVDEDGRITERESAIPPKESSDE